MNRSASQQASIFLLWLPLAVMWILMAVEQPAIAAVLARMPEAKRQLAAFGVTYSLALFIEGPIIQMLASGTAIADSRGNYRRLLYLMHLLAVGMTLVQCFLCIPAVFRPFALNVIGMPAELIENSRLALLVMLPWGMSVGYRRLWQGVLIRYGHTRVIPVTMILRILTSLGVLILGYRTGMVSGAVLGGLSLSAGVIVGALSAWFFVRPIIRRIPSESTYEMEWKSLLIFYIPLALVSFINLGARPLMQIALARGPMPLESLALYPVGMGYLFLFNSFSMSSQEVVIARLDGNESRKALLRFSLILSLSLFLIYLAGLSGPIWKLWFISVSGLSRDLSELVPKTILLGLPVIPLTTLIALYRGALVRQKRTREVTVGTAVNVSVLLIGMFLGVALLPFPALHTVFAAYSLAYITEFFYLFFRKPLLPFRKMTAA